MIDSTNPRIMANNIRQLVAAGSGGSTVVPNPEGQATGELESLGIDGSKYSIPVYAGYDIKSTEEKAGFSYNGSDVYVKEFDINAILTSTESTWLDTSVSSSGIGSLVSVSVRDSSGCVFPVQGAILSASSTIGIYEKVFENRTMVKLIVYYTKTASDAKKSKSKK